MSEKEVWCCRGFAHTFRSGGQRGFGVIVKRILDGQPMFLVQHRALDPEDMKSPLEARPGVKIEVISELVIVHCPWCGRKLEKFYRHFESLVRPGLAITD